MQLSVIISIISTLAISAFAAPALTLFQRQDEEMRFVADLANTLNQDIIHTTQFFEAFPTLGGSALTLQLVVAETAIEDATGTLGTIAQTLANDTVVQEITARLLDNNFLLDFSLQFQDIALGKPSNPFSETLGIYCSDAIPMFTSIFHIIGNFVNNGITIVALPPSNCPS